MLKQLEMGLILIICASIGALWFSWQGAKKEVTTLKTELDKTKIELGVCQADLAKKPTVVKKTEYVEVVKVVNSSGNVVSVSTNTTTHDESIVIQPKEIIKEVVKEAPVRRWTLSFTIPPTVENIKHFSWDSIGLTYQFFKKWDVNVGGLYKIREERILLQAAIRF